MCEEYNHKYAEKTCPKCGHEYCYACCTYQNVDQGGKYEPDSMLCPACGHDYYKKEQYFIYECDRNRYYDIIETPIWGYIENGMFIPGKQGMKEEIIYGWVISPACPQVGMIKIKSPEFT